MVVGSSLAVILLDSRQYAGVPVILYWWSSLGLRGPGGLRRHGRGALALFGDLHKLLGQNESVTW